MSTRFATHASSRARVDTEEDAWKIKERNPARASTVAAADARAWRGIPPIVQLVHEEESRNQRDGTAASAGEFGGHAVLGVTSD